MAEAAAASALVEALTKRLSHLQVDRSHRRRFPWRWLSSSEEEDRALSDLRRERAGAQALFDTLQITAVRAEADEKGAKRAMALEKVAMDRRHTEALAACEKRGRVVARARTLLRWVPTLASLGIRRLLAHASRIEEARLAGYDPGVRLPRP